MLLPAIGAVPSRASLAAKGLGGSMHGRIVVDGHAKHLYQQPVGTHVAAAIAVAILCACSTLPSFTRVSQFEGYKPPLSVPDILAISNHIQCELIGALEDPRPAFDRLRSEIYVSYASLTLDVTINNGITPTLNFIDPLDVAGTSKALGISGQFNGEQHRSFNQTFTLVLDPGYNKKKAEVCADLNKEPDGIKGNLGLKEIIAAGLQQVAADDFILNLASPSSSASAAQLNPDLVPNFGSSVDFTIVYGLGGGPSWTLTHFTGPAGATGLVNWSKTAKDTLAISFASAGPRPASAPVTGAAVLRDEGPLPPSTASSPAYRNIDAAGKAAQANVTRMILMRILPP